MTPFKALVISLSIIWVSAILTNIADNPLGYILHTLLVMAIISWQYVNTFKK